MAFMMAKDNIDCFSNQKAAFYKISKKEVDFVNLALRENKIL